MVVCVCFDGGGQVRCAYPTREVLDVAMLETLDTFAIFHFLEILNHVRNQISCCYLQIG